MGDIEICKIHTDLNDQHQGSMGVRIITMYSRLLTLVNLLGVGHMTMWAMGVNHIQMWIFVLNHMVMWTISVKSHGDLN